MLVNTIQVFSQPNGSIYFTDAANNFIFKWQNNKLDTIISEHLGFPWRLATDGYYIYWTSVDKNLIERSRLDGSERMEIAHVTYPEGVTVNPLTGVLFVSEGGTPAILKLQPPEYIHDTLFTEGLIDPDNIIYHAASKKLYWVDVGLQQVVEADANGGKMNVLIDDKKYNPQAIAIDQNAEFLYWADIKQKAIFRMCLSSLEIELLVSNLVKPTAITIADAERMLIWLDAGTASFGWKEFDKPDVGKVYVENISDFHGGVLYLDY